jgi:DNA topoisomerase-1
LCDAQKARRVLDRLFGYEISPVLWTHVAKKLSAGRCQSPALEIICKREREISEFSSNSFYSISGVLFRKRKSNKAPTSIAVKHPDNIADLEMCTSILSSCIVASYLVDKVEKKDRTSNPPPPFSTSTMQQEASVKLGMNPKTTMQVAQKLYERGHITYMRTDATTLSAESKRHIGDYVKKSYGDTYYYSRNFTSK